MKNTKKPIITPKKISGQIRSRGVIRANMTEIGGGRVDGLVEIVGSSPGQQFTQTIRTTTQGSCVHIFLWYSVQWLMGATENMSGADTLYRVL